VWMSSVARDAVSKALLYWESGLLSSKPGIMELIADCRSKGEKLKSAFHSTFLATSRQNEPAPENISPFPSSSTVCKGKRGTDMS
jgi:hypothetical protein